MEGKPSPRTPAAAQQTSSSTAAARKTTTDIHVTALDGIVSVNSLFTIAVFIGLTLTVPTDGSTGTRASCTAGVGKVRRLIVYEVVAFSFFLFSSLIAQGLKLALNLINSKLEEVHTAPINCNLLEFGMLGSAGGSVMGCLFLTLSIINIIEVKLGMLRCGGESVYAAVTLIVFVVSAILFYVMTTLYAILNKPEDPQNKLPSNGDPSAAF